MGGLRKRRILVADESITIQKLVHLGLASSQFEVIACSDGQDAYLKVKSLKPDLVLADCNLRHLDGFDLVEKIRNDSTLTSVKTILLKGTIPKNKEARLKNVVTDEILTKPFDTKMLLDLVHKWVLDEESTPVAATDRQNSRSHTDESLDEDTAEVRPSEFKHPVKSTGDAETTHTANPLPIAASAPSPVQMEKWVREEVTQWLDKNLPKLAEGLIKEEIQKLTKN